MEGLPAGFRSHDLRHYFASLLIATEPPEDRTSPAAARASETTLDTYGHLWLGKDESTTAVIDAVVDS